MTGRFRNPWIDRRVLRVRPIDAIAYMRFHGWEQVPTANEHFQMFAGPVASGGERITQPVPIIQDTGEYVQRIIELITNIAIIEDRPAIEVLDEMLGVSAPSANGTGMANGKPAAKEHAPTTNSSTS